MHRMGVGILVCVLPLSPAAAQDKGPDKSATPAEQYRVLFKVYQNASGGGAASDKERMKFVGRVYRLRYQLAERFLELAERYPKDLIKEAGRDNALDALRRSYTAHYLPVIVERFGLRQS